MQGISPTSAPPLQKKNLVSWAFDGGIARGRQKGL